MLLDLTEKMIRWRVAELPNLGSSEPKRGQNEAKNKNAPEGRGA